MSNTTGTQFRLTTFGESHSKAIGGVIDGCPAGIAVDESFIASEMARRHIGANATQRHETDEVQFLSGIYKGRTLGTPIAFIIVNNDLRSSDYDNLADCYRPGHADYTYSMRYGFRDPRGGSRASGRETAARVAAGAIAKTVLLEKGINIEARLLEEFRPPANDSVGGIIECTISGVAAGIGNPVFDKLNARLAAAMMSIPSAIGFEMGIGFEAARTTGSQFRDKWNDDFTTQTNHCGGIQGGISNGMPIVFRTAFHPATTVNQSTECIDQDGKLHTIVPQGRHDRNHLPRTVVVVEAMAALTIVDFIL